MLCCIALVAAFLGIRAEAPRVLFLTHSAGYEHGVVRRARPGELAPAEHAFVELARAAGVNVTATKDCGFLAPERLRAFDAVAFYTTGELPVPDEHRAHLVDWVRAGGAFVGVHPATDTFYAYAPYQDMLGGVFDGHPWTQKVRIDVMDAEHPATRGLGAAFEVDDEIYQFRRFAGEPLRILLRLDNASVEIEKGKRADGEYALAWCRTWGRGRVFYTALGHRPEVWADARFRRHLRGGLEWVLAAEPPEEQEPGEE